MNFSALSIRRPVLTYMLNAVLILFGIIAYQRIALDRFPSVEFPVVTVLTTMQGADPTIIDSSLTSVLESRLNGVPGIERLDSYSKPNSSLIILTFSLDKNIDIAFNEIQAKVNQTLAELPQQAETPVISKLEVGSMPIMWLVLQGDRTLQDLNIYADSTIKKKLETIDGVANVQIGGERERTIRVEIDNDKLNAFNLTSQDILWAFQAEHIQVPGGFVISDDEENLLNLDLEYHNIDELKNMVITYRDDLAIRLSDIADIVDGLDDPHKAAFYNGSPAVGLGIEKVSGANTVKIIKEIQRRLDSDIIPNLSPGLTLTVSTDEGKLINEIVDALKEHLVLGTLLASLVVWVFLQSVRSTLIIATTIPVSLLGAVAIMYFSGYTFNVLTLLALLLLIGVVVDDAIVVLENIYRKIEEEKLPPKQAALEGTQEVMFAVLAATLTLVCIFVPVIFLGGIIGRFFESFAVVVTVGVLISLFVALTLTPMLCARYLKTINNKARVYRTFEHFFAKMENTYRQLIAAALRHRLIVISATFIMVILSYSIAGNIGKGFLPPIDESRFMVFFKTPLGSSLSYTEQQLKKVESVLSQHQEVASLFSTIGSSAFNGSNEGQIFVAMTAKSQRHIKQYQFVEKISAELSHLDGVVAFPGEIPIAGGSRGEPLQFIIRGPELEKIESLATEMLNSLNQIKNFGHLDLDLQLHLPQYQLDVDRARASSLGLSTHEIANALTVLGGGLDVAKYNDGRGNNQRYDIRIKSKANSFAGPELLSHIYLRSAQGSLVRLDTVANLKEITAPASIFHSQLEYAAMFFALPSMPLGEAVDNVRAEANKLLPPGYSLQLEGQAKEFETTLSNIVFAMVMAVTLVYMVLASQFNSFIQPLVIMVAQPLAIIGALLALWLTGHTLNIYSMIGMVLLMGLVAKNSILLIDLTNQERAKGLSINEALLKACPHRMRPVLMTSFTVILAMLPAALGQGAGSDSNGPLAVAVIGGMLSSTLLTLVVIPSFYSLIEGGVLKREQQNKRR